MTEPKRLVRPKDAAKLGGVCAGLADYFVLDPTLVRVAWVLLTIFTAFFPGVIAYIVCWLVIPEAPTASRPTFTPPGDVR